MKRQPFAILPFLSKNLPQLKCPTESFGKLSLLMYEFLLYPFATTDRGNDGRSKTDRNRGLRGMDDDDGR